MLAVPTRGAIRWETVTRLEEIRDLHPSVPPILYQAGNLSVALTRNRIVQAFLASPCDVLVMVDDDVVAPPHLLELADKLDGYGIVAVPHPMPMPGNPAEVILSAFDTAPGGLVAVDTLEHGMNDVDAVATGCCLVTRAALVAVGPNPFRIDNDPATAVSDDFLFCADVRELGFRVGAWWDGWYADHVTTVSLAPLREAQTRTTERSS